MQYFKPRGSSFVGDCMPFSHAGVFHLYYLLDEGHHQAKGGLGGHQWAHASTTDLIHWTHHPLAIPLSEDCEGSICTGSVFFHEGVYHAYHGTRLVDWSQRLSHATSRDGISFVKDPHPVGYPPPGYSRNDFRDPCVYIDDAGQFQMLVTAKIEEYPLHDQGGCLLRLSSGDLERWPPAGPFLIPGGEPGYGSIPECPDLFYWQGWYYLLFGLKLHTHYRMARRLSGPWLRPAVDRLDNRLVAVMKTASFGSGRRIGAAWVPARQGDRDEGELLWGGNAVFRELVQLEDGSLGTRFPLEMNLPEKGPVEPHFSSLTQGASGSAQHILIDAPETREAGMLAALPEDFHLRCKVNPQPGSVCFGLGLRGEGNMARQYPLAFYPHRQRVDLAQESLECVAGLDGPFDLEVIARGDLIDVCVDRRRCIINRLPELRGERLFFFCENGAVAFDQIEIIGLQN